jgi:hypothetical protein
LPRRPPHRRPASTPISSDHQLSWALTDLRRDGFLQNPARGLWAFAGAALESLEPAVQASAPAARVRELQLMPYRDYLRTPEWRRTRGAALERALTRCNPYRESRGALPQFRAPRPGSSPATWSCCAGNAIACITANAIGHDAPRGHHHHPESHRR